MTITAQLKNGGDRNEIVVSSHGSARSLSIPAKPNGAGSSVNGGEMLFLALATCYCNDLYREAAKRGVPVVGVEVAVEGEFGGVGEAARSIGYRAKVTARAPKPEIEALMVHTDTVAEIHNTLRKGMPVDLLGIEAVSV